MSGFLILFLGIGGVLFSTYLSNYISVGASGSIMGIVSAYLVFIIINWGSL